MNINNVLRQLTHAAASVLIYLTLEGPCIIFCNIYTFQ